MKLFQVWYDNYGDQEVDIFASAERPSDESVLKQLVSDYGISDDQEVEVFEITHVPLFGSERTQIKVNLEQTV